MGKERNYGIDLLRVFLMLMIVAGHLLVHTGIRGELANFSFKWNYTWICQTILLCAVNCFVLITGYFANVNSHSIRIKKLLLLYGQVLFYSVSIYLILLVLGKTNHSLFGILFETINAVFPFSSGQYWFFSSYILLMLLAPFLNLMLSKLNDFALKILTAVIIALFYVLPIFQIVFMQFDVSEGMGIIGFITLYIIGHALKRFKIKIPKVACVFGIILNCAMIFASKIVLAFIVEKLQMNVGSSLLYNYNMITQLVNAVLLLFLFKEIKIKKTGAKIISFISASTFGIYLLHEHPNIRGVIWNEWLKKLLLESNGITYVVLSLAIPIVLFLLCLIIDVVRRLLGKALAKIKLVQKVNKALVEFENKINEKMTTQKEEK